MNKYKLSNIERKTTSTGKPMIKCEVTYQTPQGVEMSEDGVAIWSSFPYFATLKDGDVVEGTLETKVNGKFTNKTLNPPFKAPTGANGGQSGGFKGNMQKVMEQKEQSIEKFTDKKELGIKISSTMRMAVDCAISDGNGEIKLEDRILRWRKWLWENWDAKDTDFAPWPTKHIPDERVRPEDRDLKLEDITFNPKPNYDAEEEYNRMGQ